MPFRDVILQQVEKKHTEWNGQIMKMAGMDYDTYSKLAIGLLAELKGYIGAMCDTVLGLYNAGSLTSVEADYLIKQILGVSYTVADAVRLTAATCQQIATGVGLTDSFCFFAFSSNRHNKSMAFLA